MEGPEPALSLWVSYMGDGGGQRGGSLECMQVTSRLGVGEAGYRQQSLNLSLLLHYSLPKDDNTGLWQLLRLKVWSPSSTANGMKRYLKLFRKMELLDRSLLGL